MTPQHAITAGKTTGRTRVQRSFMAIHPQKTFNIFPKISLRRAFLGPGKRIPETASFYDIAPPQDQQMK